MGGLILIVTQLSSSVSDDYFALISLTHREIKSHQLVSTITLAITIISQSIEPDRPGEQWEVAAGKGIFREICLKITEVFTFSQTK